MGRFYQLNNDSNIRSVIFRGIRRRCPSCGKDKIFDGYLLAKDNCPSCEVKFEGIRTDDAAPWATIFVVGHLLAPIVVILVNTDLETITVTILLVLLAVLASLVLLPFFKGLFLGLNWYFRKKENN